MDESYSYDLQIDETGVNHDRAARLVGAVQDLHDFGVGGSIIERNKRVMEALLTGHALISRLKRSGEPVSGADWSSSGLVVSWPGLKWMVTVCVCWRSASWRALLTWRRGADAA